jgi:hypothetical protein
MLAIVLTPLTAPGGLPAQEITLRYAPRAGAVTHVVSWTEMTATIGEAIPGGGFGFDSVVIEVAEVESLTEAVSRVEPRRAVVQITYDSLRSRLRPIGGSWRSDVDGSGPVTAFVARDSLRRRLGLQWRDSSVAGGARADRLRSLVGRVSVPLPETSIVVGAARQDVTLELPFRAPAGLEDVVPLPVLELTGAATVVLDSIVARAADTLAYLRMHGALHPPQAERGLETALRVTRLEGSFAGSLVWSTAWSAYVSGATRVIMTVDFLRGPGAGPLQGTRARFDSLYRYQVRP